MRIGVTVATLAACTAAASAAPASRFELSGFLGVDKLDDDIELGGSSAPEQRPQTAPTFGGRLTFIPLSLGNLLHLGVEGETSFTASWTGYGFDGPRESYFAPVLNYRANVLVRLFSGWLQPHVLAGGGGATVLSSSPYMAKETLPIFQWGVGATLPMNGRWLLRFDGRQGLIEAIDGGTAYTYEAHVSIGAYLGVRTARPVIHEEPPPVVIKPPPPPVDSDGDGLVDPDDTCPTAAELVNGIADDDGCPEPDSDGDGLVDPADTCPAQAEDKDGFEDADGCVDADNDGDGVLDAKDRCATEPETRNGISDDDGCPDAVPVEVTEALAEASKIKFEKDRARLGDPAKRLLDKTVAIALAYKTLKLTLTVHPDAAGDKATELANKRIAVIKFYLTEQGVAMNNLTTQVGAPAATKKAPRVELTVTQP